MVSCTFDLQNDPLYLQGAPPHPSRLNSKPMPNAFQIVEGLSAHGARWFHLMPLVDALCAELVPAGGRDGNGGIKADRALHGGYEAFRPYK